MTARTRLDRVFWWAIAGAVTLTALIALTAPALARFHPLLPDKGSSWYFWQLPEPTILARVSSWGLYLLHQVSLWYLAFRFRREADHHEKPSRLNIAAIAVNGAFVLLHILQTQLFYDGLAQDVPVWTIQGSVIAMLVIMIYSLTPRRGLILGFKPKFKARALSWVRSWHGFYISWAFCYTFWFHPTEGDFGLLTGFFYMFLLFVQFSFARTRWHVAIGWLTLLETMVALHGPAIAIQKAMAGNEGDIAGSFAWRGYHRLFEVTFIPAALYGSTIALAVTAGIVSRLFPGNTVTPIETEKTA